MAGYWWDLGGAGPTVHSWVAAAKEDRRAAVAKEDRRAAVAAAKEE